MSGGNWPWTRGLKPVLQAEAAECGLACLTMVAAWHGHKVDLPGLRRIHPPSIKGMTLEALMGAAAALDLSPRALRLELDELPQLQLPAILHWDLAHFVVLEKVDRTGITIIDPASGRKHVTLDQASRHMTGVALELSPTAAFRPVEATRKIRLRDLWSRVQGWGSAATQIITLSLLLQMTALLLPLYLQLTVDQAIGQSNADLLVLLVVGFGLVYLLNIGIATLRAWVQLTVGQSLSYQLGGNVVRHLIRLPVAFFERRHVGDLMSRVRSIEPIKNLLTHGVINAMIDALLAVTTLVVMALISPTLALLVFVTTALYLGVSQAMYPAIRRRSEEEIVARAKQDTYLMETMRGMSAIKLHTHEPIRESGWRNRYAEVISASYRTGMLGIRLDMAEQLIFSVQLLLIVYLGALAVLGQQMTVGLLIAFLAYRGSFTASASGLVDQLQSWRLINLHLERLSDIVGEPAEPLMAAPRSALLPPPGLKAESLSFRYAPGEKPVFEKLEFEVPAGQMAAIVGPSGAGKSTMMRLMLGLLEPTEGRLLADGAPLTSANLAAWRGRVGAVMQDDYLLAGTLEENIAFFDPQASEDRVKQAARLARIHDDISKMPMGYQSLVGDMGTALSAGQRQRVLLARALYRDPDILFLDEGTANLDPVTEGAITDMIAMLPITRVVIAHRPSLVERADIVFELKDGKLVQRQQNSRPADRLSKPA
jgi:ATP-binding cassette, subfamily B, bacterial CvaB/MchF/RaxB